jgi:hypothetical protein
MIRKCSTKTCTGGSKHGTITNVHIRVSGCEHRTKLIKTTTAPSLHNQLNHLRNQGCAPGFEKKAGILAFAATSHVDFDDTPLFDENGDGDRANDGDVWHSHWVVLEPDDACGKGNLKVVDIAEGTKPRVPKTWPGLPILIDSPGWSPTLKGNVVEVRVPFDDVAPIANAGFDGITAGLRVSQSVHSPLLCVENVFKVASGDLSLPGKVNR